ncbi:hypothetical protein EUTSA_v10011020mg [Eutrema salsugineum]|uniref:Uncharacterized protein n=1 Tax=Eutrema salsugineum TaxID=72664 RepID=V4L539_EUTSA|nr:uncharacterized protein At3g50808 [Eutrema salsugineum]ESQ45450.1 hypothetical protein EUTSA_v10011020mg [Eutrema salsugineum]
MDTSGIHPYRINKDYVFFINQRRESDNHRSRNNVPHKCKVCEWDLKEATSSDLFCSIECKFRNALGSQLDDLMENPEDVVVEPVVKKKHRRKGIPYRSPFY